MVVSNFLMVYILLVAAVAGQPNIVFIFVDDLGWNDVGYHDSEIMVKIIYSVLKSVSHL